MVSPVERELQNLATQFLLHIAERPEQKAFLVTCPRAGEGTTTILSRVGLALAEISRLSVLLADGNLRSPEMHAVWGVPLSPGISDALVEGNLEAAIQRTRCPSLSLLPAGNPCANPMELFLSQGFKDAVVRLRQKFDLILFDSAPLLVCKDALALGSGLDGAVLVVRSRFTVRRSTQRCLEMLSDRGIPVHAAVLNRKRRQVPKLFMTLFNLQE